MIKSTITGYIILLLIGAISFYFRDIKIFIIIAGAVGLLSMMPMVVAAILSGNVKPSLYGTKSVDKFSTVEKNPQKPKLKTNIPLFILIAGIPNFIAAFIIALVAL